ncbi:type IVB secretion system protein IcmH/DotU [Celeribacter halophilus]|uniref:type IVB secretion system protein IcmH/DotU n=1 Tax=Celeribacter halophilus TaxID=576117 RepID=UPI003A8FF624
MSDDDDDRTVFGQKIPPASPAPQPSQTPHGQQPPAQPGWPMPPSAQQGPRQNVPPHQPQYGQPPAQPSTEGASERTVFGMKMPPQQPQVPPAQGYPQQPQGYAPQPPSQPTQTPQPPASGAEDTWFGGRLPPQPAQPQMPSSSPDEGTWFQGRAPQQPPSYQPPPQQPAYGQPAQGQGAGSYAQPSYQQPPYGQPPQPNWQGQYPQGYGAPYGAQHPAGGGTDGQFPMVAPVQPEAAFAGNVPKISFQDALKGSGLDIGTSSNPILAAASDLLVLFGRLRTGMVEMQAIPLRDHVIRQIGEFVRKAQEKGVPPEDIEVARYALAATADDIVQTIPGSDPGYWQQYSMAAELLNDRSAGIGFFARLDHVIAYPAQRKDLLELMLTCLYLGFEGKYRTEPNGMAMLARLRNEVYQRLRSVVERPKPDLSINWLPVVFSGKRNGAGMPLWVVAAIGGGMVVALFATLSWILSTDTNAAQAAILRLNDPNATVAIEGQSFAPSASPYVGAVDTTQLDRIREALAPEIEEGALTVAEKGDYIMIRVGDVLRFRSGSADLSSDFSALAQSIAQTLDHEPGGIVIEGHSDSVPLRGTGRYRTNEELSEARAATVRDVLAQSLGDPSRMSVVGVGPNDPIDTSGTREAQARNRRVEILLQQESKI